jgi:hypothetical protein
MKVTKHPPLTMNHKAPHTPQMESVHKKRTSINFAMMSRRRRRRRG